MILAHLHQQYEAIEMSQLTIRDIHVFNTTLNQLTERFANSMQWEYTKPALVQLIDSLRVDMTELDKLSEALQGIPAHASPLEQWLQTLQPQDPFGLRAQIEEAAKEGK